MALEHSELIAHALASLTAAERARAIVYLDDQPLPAGAPVRLGDIEVEIPWPALAFFVDLEPTANWGHTCCYLLVHRDTGEVRRVSAQFPPFLKGTSPTLHLVWRGPAAPSWAAVVTR